MDLCPIRRFLLELRSYVPAPGTQKRVIARNPQRFLQVWRIEDVIVIDENKDVALRLADSAKPRGRQSQLILAHMAAMRMPGNVEPFRNRLR